MNKLKNDLEKYLESECGTGMLLLIGKDEAAQMLNVFKALDKACAELVKLKECADCWEYEKHCPFSNECQEGTNYCYDTRCWKEWLLNNE